MAPQPVRQVRHLMLSSQGAAVLFVGISAAVLILAVLAIAFSEVAR